MFFIKSFKNGNFTPNLRYLLKAVRKHKKMKESLIRLNMVDNKRI